MRGVCARTRVLRAARVAAAAVSGATCAARGVAAPLRRAPLFALPSVMDAHAFVQYVRKQADVLEELIVVRRLAADAALRSRAFDAAVRAEAQSQCAPLRRLRQVDVEAVVYGEKYSLRHERLVTCLVPYQAAVNMLLARVPPWLRDACVAELRRDEAAVMQQQQQTTTSSAIAAPPAAQWLQWYDEDVYVHTGTSYLARSGAAGKRRACVFGVLGDAGHGKTTLLDTLLLQQQQRQQSGTACMTSPLLSSIVEAEPHGVTQALRSFTIASPLQHTGSSSTTSNKNTTASSMTFIDTPGHRLFVEARFHVQLICDVVLLVVSVADAVRVQTHECVKVALNVDRPVIVVLSKLDALGDVHAARAAVRRVLAQLSEMGLDVTLVQNEADLAPYDVTACTTTTRDNGGGGGSAVSATASAARVVFARMCDVDATYAGSRRHPRVHLRRRCLGVCVSARQRVRLPVLWLVLHACAEYVAPTCYSDATTSSNSSSSSSDGGDVSSTAPPSSSSSERARGTSLCTVRNCVVQAVVVEASKHLYNAEGFAHNAPRRRIQAALDAAVARRERRRDAGVGGNIMAQQGGGGGAATAQMRHMYKRNRTSTASLVLDVVVREGVVRRGMHFVADQAEGCVTDVFDYHGNALACALPGAAVTLVDRNSVSGCPGVGTHVLSMTSATERLRVHRYRQLLQWFVELFPHALHLLRPRGHDVSFAHLGDYGQLGCTTSLEYQLLYGSSGGGGSDSKAAASDAQRASGTTATQQPQQHVQATTSVSLSSSSLDSGGEAAAGAQLAIASSATSIAEYLAEVRSSLAHREDEDEDSDTTSNNNGDTSNNNNAVVPSTTTTTTATTTRRRLGQGLVDGDAAVALVHAWRRLQHATQPATHEEHAQRLSQCTHVGVLLKVDCWHSARMLMREAARAGTRRVHFEVLGVRFGALCRDDMEFFGHAVRIVVCYRTPRVTSVEVDRAVEAQGVWLLQTDHVADVTPFVRWCAVTLHTELAPDDTHDARAMLAATTTTTTQTTLELPSPSHDKQQQQQPQQLTSSAWSGQSAQHEGDAQLQHARPPQQPRKRKLLVVDRALCDEDG